MMLSLFDRSGVMAQPWADAGYKCLCVDIEGDKGVRDGVQFVRADVRDWTAWLPIGEQFDFVAAFPPCTHLSASGARWWADKGPGALSDAAALVQIAWQICEWSQAPYCIENPVGRLSSIWRKPDHEFDPCDYGDPYTKRTCLWTGGGFVMPTKRPVTPTQGSKMHLLPPSADRARLRSETPGGFARAVFESNNRRRQAA